MPNKWYKKQKKKKTEEKSTKKCRYIFFQKYYSLYIFPLYTSGPLDVCVCQCNRKKNTDREAPQYLLRIFQRLICEFNICALNPRRVSPRQKQVTNKGNFLLICLQTKKTKKNTQYNTIQYKKTSMQRSVDAFLVRSGPENSLWFSAQLVMWQYFGSAQVRFRTFSLPFRNDKNEMKTPRYAD